MDQYYCLSIAVAANNRYRYTELCPSTAIALHNRLLGCVSTIEYQVFPHPIRIDVVHAIMVDVNNQFFADP